VGDGERPYERDGGAAQMKEINDFASVLTTAIPAHDTAVVSLVVATVGAPPATAPFRRWLAWC